MKHTVTLRNGDQVPALGIGTWYLGEDRTKRKQELESLKEGVHAGMTLIDTAEMYGSGKAELLVKEAMRDILKSYISSLRYFRIMQEKAELRQHWIIR